MESNRNPWSLMEINGNEMEIWNSIGNLWNPVEINRILWKFRESMWESIGFNGNLINSMEIHRILMEFHGNPVKIRGIRWKSMEFKENS